MTDSINTETAKRIAKNLRTNRYLNVVSANARLGVVRVKHNGVAGLIADVLPPGWGTRSEGYSGATDTLLVKWVG